MDGRSKRGMVLGGVALLMLAVLLPACGCRARTEESEALAPAERTEPVTKETVVAADEQVVGYETGTAAGMLGTEARSRMAERPPQDLIDKSAGRYTLMNADGVSGHWGLDAIKARCEVAPKPAAALVDADGVLQTERVVFADTGTGATMMMLTRIPYEAEGPGDQLNYFGKACWSADGTHMLWVRDAKAGLWGPNYQKTTDEYGPMRVDADGTGARIIFRDVPAMKPPICSPVRPDAAYAWAGGKILELNLRTGTVRKTLGDMQYSWHLKVSPDDKYVVSKVAEGFRVLATADGQVWDVKLDEAKTGRCYPIHDSYRFLPADTDWIMYWYERSHPGGGLNKEGFRLRNFKTGAEKIVPFRFDWNHGDVGRYFGFHCTPYVTEWNGSTFEPNVGLAWPEKTWTDAGPWYSQPHNTGGYAAQWPDDQRWGYCCIYIHDKPGQAYLSEISKIFAKPLAEGGRVNRFRICYNNLWGRTDRWGNPSVGLMRPNMSPDGTKLLFNSNVFCRDGVFMVVCARPLAPTDVTAEHRGCDVGVEVRWKAPKYHREIAGYHVYRSDESGKGFRLITPKPVSGTTFLDEEGDVKVAHFYAVRSVERSGLESSLSAEVPVGPLDADWLSIFCEAEKAISADLDAPSPDAIWVNFEGMASDLYYIWQRRRDKAGLVETSVNVRRSGKYYVFARVKGKEGAAFTIAGQSVSAPAGDTWQWVRSEAAAELSAGEQTVGIASSKYGSSLDCFYLAEDKDYKPTGRIIATKPKALTLTAEAHESGVRLTWIGAKSPRWSHYNLYVSDKADFEPTQAMLLASPDRESYLDWQAKPGAKRYYKVTQTTKDGLESVVSNAASAP